ncbi:glycosyltransferase [Nocardioides lianchengensis]|uniref:Galactofuranosylgalactofuranosylrhamnosyl-N-acetylglucosaminyl-diphospho-decaprenol beta-1,5/1,6-galactofuranosyltransferase n=1 Tax=Nocardioides lianchengensis TaxID=1045774 RepID=A0A1G6JXN7_9ACTN|nr:glycosyltransferase [Nocardioides lianchengensis]NYG08796.1 galactofuranosylgalactofuranosylrhamnosyl-N-acetylglucosaminyl-diphospho-decaprenol beta-1,5/1,6-galactofuranosyltransferase [Nocardioides lianchengensis]SDC22776.1 galactofuranosylgalactofuranosylrhamnosyl-N-acetylglucosaminyl-diphospho-decaprenol beta-1,5/1,6-galactofuranosyltransferase [Nocardioides lianchengensis]
MSPGRVTDTTAPTTVRRVLQRQIMPADRDLDVLPLYVDPDPAVLDADKYNVGGNKGAKEVNKATLRQQVSSGTTIDPDQIVDRFAVRVEHGNRLSFGSYFNAFPASYWRRWTIVDEVRLSVELEGRGSSVTVYKSMANGRSQRVASQQVDEGAAGGTFVFDLSLRPFVDGGWYWYDVTAGDEDVVVRAVWDTEVPADRAEPGSVTVTITTMNRPSFCADLVGQLGSEEDVLGVLDAVLVVDQGTEKVREHADFPAAEKALDGRLRVIEQGNLGGSGGYARGQLETVRAGTSTYALMMDDDVVCEPQSILRAVTFGDLARRPTIVGGHMFSLYSRSRLHSFGEIIQTWRWWWMTPEHVLAEWDFGARNLRSTRWLHRRVDVDFNGWFMCLIPRQVLDEIGLSLPVFIKWDDSEFGVRAKAAGYPTVTFPGAAVWHVPWTDKNDALDWQAYFHQRNRIIAALLHSPYKHGGRLVQESVNHTIAHLVSMQYSTVELRQLALEDVLAGPDKLHEVLPHRLGDVNTFRKQYADAQLQPDPDAFPPVRRKPTKRGHSELEVPSKLSQLITAGLMPLRQLRKPRALSREFPEAEIAAMDAKWYRIARYDSAVVSMPDQTSAALYTRDPELYRDLLKRITDLHVKLYRRWPELAAEYRAKLPEITSPEAWDQTFAPWTGGDGEKAGER